LAADTNKEKGSWLRKNTLLDLAKRRSENYSLQDQFGGRTPASFHPFTLKYPQAFSSTFGPHHEFIVISAREISGKNDKSLYQELVSTLFQKGHTFIFAMDLYRDAQRHYWLGRGCLFQALQKR
jgi:hypothetical protein